MTNTNLTADILLQKLQRINAISEILYDLLADDPQKQILAEIIAETSAATDGAP